jgi:phospho-N-acetylmuramoyl-pentapeptide-transferase
MLVTTVWLGLIGFLDDYIKVFKKDKAGLAGKFKILGQVGLGLIIGYTLYFNPYVLVKEKVAGDKLIVLDSNSNVIDNMSHKEGAFYSDKAVKSTKTTIPFYKNNEFDYANLLKWIGPDYRRYAWLIFIPIVIFIITAVSNGANITDGIDGLATGTSAIIGATLGILAYVSGNTVFASYLKHHVHPECRRAGGFHRRLCGGMCRFPLVQCLPGPGIHGRHGQPGTGGIIATFAIAIRKELLIPVLCGIFLVESLSIMLQVSYFKYTGKKYGEGRRIFKMSPLHHHYQKLGYHESKIVTRFWIVGIVLAHTHHCNPQAAIMGNPANESSSWAPRKAVWAPPCWRCAKGMTCFVSDMGTIAAKYKQVLEENRISFEETRHTEGKILNADEVIKSPAFLIRPDDSKDQGEGIPVISEIEFAGRIRMPGSSALPARTARRPQPC